MAGPFQGYILTNIDGSAEAPGGIIANRKEISDANVLVTDTDCDIVYVTLTAERTVTLPLASTLNINRMFNVKDETGNAGKFNITIETSGSDTIEGEPDALINKKNTSLTLYTDGVNQFFIK